MNNYNPFSLEGKTVLVTGASSGLGQATAIECSRLGARLIITARNLERLQETFTRLEGEGHQQIAAELTDANSVKNLVDNCPEMDGVVLCVGISVVVPFLFATREKFDKLFNPNYFAPVELLRILGKQKKIKRGGSVVFVSSIGGITKFTSGNVVYGAAKAALTATMKYCAREFAPKKIRVNGVNPGMVETKLIHSGAVSEEQHEKDKANYLLGRYGDPVDIAHGIIYLLSDASSWVTGHSLIIDGGTSV